RGALGGRARRLGCRCGRRARVSTRRGSQPLARLILRKGFFLTAKRVAPPGSSTMRKLADALEELRAAWPDLPGAEDVEREVPPVARCWERRVRGTALVVCFSVGQEGVAILAVKVLGT